MQSLITDHVFQEALLHAPPLEYLIWCQWLIFHSAFWEPEEPDRITGSSEGQATVAEPTFPLLDKALCLSDIDQEDVSVHTEHQGRHAENKSVKRNTEQWPNTGQEGHLVWLLQKHISQPGKQWWNYLPDQTLLKVFQGGCISNLRSRMTPFDLLLGTLRAPKGSVHNPCCCQCQHEEPCGRADSRAHGWVITLDWALCCEGFMLPPKP